MMVKGRIFFFTPSKLRFDNDLGPNHMKTSDILRLGVRLCASNGAMMIAWFLLVPVPMVVWLAVFASHALASLEYAIQVPANAAAHERKLGLIVMRAPQEVVMFAAFVAICWLARQHIYLQQLFAFPLIVLAASLIVRPSISKRQLMAAGAIILGACAIAVSFFRLPHIIKAAPNHLAVWNATTIPWFVLLSTVFIIVSSLLVTLIYVPALRQQIKFVTRRPRTAAVLLELLLCGIAAVFVTLLTHAAPAPSLLTLALIASLCFIPNSFMIVAWYSHTQIKPLGKMRQHPKLFKYLVAWGTAFLEYSFLIPLLRYAYQYLGIFQVFGLMELSTITVFLIFARLVSKKEEEPNVAPQHVVLYGSLIMVELAFCLVG
jgi:uncharacterized protein (DUF486 family)